jgi:hypothetical protein
MREDEERRWDKESKSEEVRSPDWSCPLHIIFINVAVRWVGGVHLLEICGMEDVITRVLLSSDPLLMSEIFILTMLALGNTTTVLDDIVPPMTALVVTSDGTHELTDL